MAIRLLHSADLHLDAPLRLKAMADPDLRDLIRNASRGALERMVRHCREGGISALLLAGDIFDSAVQSVQTAAFFVGRMRELREIGVAVYLIRGNHDFEHRAAWKIALPPNVHEFTATGGSHAVAGLGEGVAVHVHGVSYGERSAAASLLPLYPQPEPGAVNIGLMHTSLAGASGHNPYAPCTVESLVAQGYDYWALGHVHGRTVHAEGPAWVVMPGAPQGRHINETGAKSATEITLGDRGVASVREVSTGSVLFEHVEVRCDADTAGDLETLCQRAVEDRAGSILGDGQALVVRVRLTGPPEVLRRIRSGLDLRHETVAEALRTIGNCWLDGLTFAPVHGGAAAAEGGPIAEIAASMRSTIADPATRLALRGILDSHLQPLPPALRAEIAGDPDTLEGLLDSLAEQGIEEVVAALDHGAEDGA